MVGTGISLTAAVLLGCVTNAFIVFGIVGVDIAEDFVNSLLIEIQELDCGSRGVEYRVSAIEHLVLYPLAMMCHPGTTWMCNRPTQ